MKKAIAPLLLVLGLLSGSANATSPMRPAYMYGAIAYQTVPGSYYNPPTYNVSGVGGYIDAYRAAADAKRDCGWGCGYFTFFNGCAGIVFTAPALGNVANYGYQTAIVNFNGRSVESTRNEVERRLQRACLARGIRCVETVTQCSDY